MEVLISGACRIDFGEKWALWIRFIFDTRRMVVLVNGSPSSGFGAGRGLR